MRNKYSFVPVAGAQLPVNNNAVYTAIQGQVTQYFTQSKAARTQAAANATQIQQNEVQAALLQDGSPHAALHKYEKAHLAIGTMTVAQLEVEIKNYMRANHAGANLSFLPQANHHEVYARPDAAGRVSALIGAIYADDQRFVPVQPAIGGLLNPVFERNGQPGRHYVQLPDNTYLRRFVTRGLNQSDSLNLAFGRPLQAPQQSANAVLAEIQSQVNTGRHQVMAGAALTLQQRILSHTRGWQKRFISTTTTKRPVYSTRGEQFRSVFGAVLIDLANIPLATIVDLHRPDRLNAHIGIAATTVTDATAAEPPYPRTLDHERFLAGRDVIRTREVLISGQVPFNAVSFGARTRCVLGIRGAPEEAHWGRIVARDVSGRQVIATESLEYQWQGGTWTFSEFGSEADAQHALKIVRPGVIALLDAVGATFGAMLFTRYSLPHPLPAGY